MPNSRHQGRPERKEWPQCKAEGCLKTTQGGAFGFCHSHYMACRRGHLDSSGRWNSPMGRNRCSITTEGCKIPNCNFSHYGRGFCRRHLRKFNAGLLGANGEILRIPVIGRPRKKDKWVGVDGYALVPAPPGHPRARQDGSILEHRLVIESKIGRYLEDWEIVHHKNGDRSDNRPENLELLDGRARNGTEAHPPGHEFNLLTAIQVVLQSRELPVELVKPIQDFRERLVN